MDTNETNSNSNDARDGSEFFANNHRPAPKREHSKSICTRLEIVVAVAWVILRAFREGRCPMLAELVENSGLLPSYPTKCGLAKSIGDAIGHNGKDSAKLWRGADGSVRRACENVANLMVKIPVSARQSVVEKAGFADVSELVAFAKTLPVANG